MANWKPHVSHRSFISLALLSIALILVVSGFLNFFWHDLLFLLGTALVGLLLFLKPWWGFLTLLFIRPSIDIYGGKSLTHWGSFDLTFNILLGVLVFIWAVVYGVRKYKVIKKGPRFFAVLLFIILCGVSIFYSIAPLNSAREFVRIGGIFLLSFAVFALVKSKKRLKMLGAVIVASLTLPLIFASWQYFTQTGQPVSGHNFLRIYGTLAHPNSLAFLLVLGFTILVSWYSRFENKGKKAGVMVLGLLMFLALLATYTRGAWLGFAVFALIFGFFYARRLLVVLVAAGGIIYFVSPFLRERVFDLIRPDLWGSIIWRWDLWKGMLPFWKTKPIFGYGLGTFEILAERLYGFYAWSYEAHNDYLRLGVELGAVGLFLYLMIYVKTIIALLRSFLRAKSKDLKPFFLGGVCLFIAFLIMSFGDNILRGTALQWALWSYGAGLLRLAMKKD